jgi:hypothetical protein
MKLLHELDDTLEYSIAMPALRACGAAGQSHMVRFCYAGFAAWACGFAVRVPPAGSRQNPPRLHI